MRKLMRKLFLRRATEEDTPPDTGDYPGTPRWEKVFKIIGIVVVLLFVGSLLFILLFSGGGKGQSGGMQGHSGGMQGQGGGEQGQGKDQGAGHHGPAVAEAVAQSACHRADNYAHQIGEIKQGDDPGGGMERRPGEVKGQVVER